MERGSCILSLSNDSWDTPYWTSRQFLTYCLSKHARVLYATDRPEIRSLRSHRREVDLGSAPFAPPPGLEVLRASWPRTYRLRRLDGLMHGLHAKELQGRLRRARPARRILYVWHPSHVTTVERLEYDLLVYHPFDMFRHFDGSSDAVAMAEARLCELADAVVTPHQKVAEALGHPQSHVVHNGVFLPAFPDFRSLPTPPQMHHVARPVIGYLGAINDKIDFELMADIARARPDWQFVMVGPRGGGRWRDSNAFRAFSGRSNSIFLPGVPIDRVAPIMASFDVGLIPYRLEGWARFSESPLKLYQYWAMGVPVAVSPLPNLGSEPGSLEVGEAAQDWVEGIERLLQARSETSRWALRQRALEHSWEERAARVMEIIDAI